MSGRRRTVNNGRVAIVSGGRRRTFGNGDSNLQRDLERHSLSWRDFGRLVEEQRYRCGVCKQPFGWGFLPHVDVNDLGIVRGLLCAACMREPRSIEYTQMPPARRVFRRNRWRVKT